MTSKQHERWRIHREHCTSVGRGEPCWGPDACKKCVEIGNAKPSDGGQP